MLPQLGLLPLDLGLLFGPGDIPVLLLRTQSIAILLQAGFHSPAFELQPLPVPFQRRRVSFQSRANPGQLLPAQQQLRFGLGQSSAPLLLLDAELVLLLLELAHGPLQVFFPKPQAALTQLLVTLQFLADLGDVGGRLGPLAVETHMGGLDLLGQRRSNGRLVSGELLAFFLQIAAFAQQNQLQVVLAGFGRGHLLLPLIQLDPFALDRRFAFGQLQFPLTGQQAELATFVVELRELSLQQLLAALEFDILLAQVPGELIVLGTRRGRPTR
jgi:hypothetical protein